MNFDVNDFVVKYKGSKWFLDSKLFAEFLNDINNEELLSNIKFANDYLDIPPILSYVRYRKDIYNSVVDRKDKIALGACFGYLYQFGRYAGEYYEAKSVWVGDKVTQIKTASFFPKK